jgi:hypothetical protein
LVSNQIPPRSSRTIFIIPRTENKPGNARHGDRPGTHGARFEGDIDGAIGKSPTIKVLSRGPQGKDLGMGGGVTINFTRIRAGSNDFATRVNYNCANGNISPGAGRTRLVNCHAHVVLVINGHLFVSFFH